MDRYKKTSIAAILGIFGNLLLLIMKLIIGLVSKSHAMLSDAVNSGGDIITSLVTFIGNKIASKKPDKDHNLGHGKAEYVFSLIISMFIVLLAIDLIYSSTISLLKHNSFVFSKYLIIVCVITIIIKFSLFLYTNSIAKKYNNILMHANSKDHINDCIITLVNLIACILGKYGIFVVDSLVGIVVAIWILYQGVSLFKNSYDILIDKSISDDIKKQIMEIIKKYPEIVKINHFNSTPVGYQYQLSLTIFVDGNMTTFESHEIANKLEKEITKLDEIYLVVIHVNPI